MQCMIRASPTSWLFESLNIFQEKRSTLIGWCGRLLPDGFCQHFSCMRSMVATLDWRAFTTILKTSNVENADRTVNVIYFISAVFFFSAISLRFYIDQASTICYRRSRLKLYPFRRSIWRCFRYSNHFIKNVRAELMLSTSPKFAVSSRLMHWYSIWYDLVVTQLTIHCSPRNFVQFYIGSEW